MPGGAWNREYYVLRLSDLAGANSDEERKPRHPPPLPFVFSALDDIQAGVVERKNPLKIVVKVIAYFHSKVTEAL